MNETKLDQFNNRWYKPSGNPIGRLLWYFVNAAIFKSSFPFYYPKVMLLKLFGAKVGNGVVIKPHVNIKRPSNLILGNHIWIGEQVWIDNLAKVIIEDNVCISQGAMLLCGNHNYNKSSFDLMVGEIVLERGSWIGARALVGPGIRVKSHAVLSVNSVATNDLEPFSIYRGNPAIKVKDRIIGG
jgi:putative colanic acid biosynthesis acetyltransferase WcaF